MDKQYEIATIAVRLRAAQFHFNGLMPFEVEEPSDAPQQLDLNYDPNTRTVSEEMQCIDTFDFPDANAICRLYRYAGGYLFTMSVEARNHEVRFDLPDNTAEAFCNFAEGDDRSLFRFGLWVAFNLRASEQGVMAIHSSVLTYAGGAVLCLGESGTGKSTHTRLWREHIEGTELLNDDSPMLRISDGVATVYGSPWSGKTPCYRNLSYPIRGFMRLSQAPENEIRKLSVIAAYGALQPSMPPSFTHDEALFDRVNNLLSELLRRVPTYHLRCLPNREAAELARKTIFEQ
ncbi:MAG: hypothetical protein IKZ12_00550 [Alistipes sp.]|nr:hypothetical protein [Alistipes sp.]